MSIDTAFIPCAGLGTRMGEVAKTLPKPLWPLFDKTLLDLQISLLSNFGVENFLINTHIAPELFIKMRESKKELSLSLFYEEQLLGSGGSFFNIKKKSSTEKALILNSDIQILLSDHDQKRFEGACAESDALLLCLPVSKDSGYNKVCFDQEMNFLEVVKGEQKEDHYTYSGMGMINFSRLGDKSGVRGFFEDVFLNQYFERKVFIPQEPFEYWDWGTLKDYLESIKKLDFSKPGSLENLLLDHRFLDLNEWSSESYKSTVAGVYNFTRGSSAKLSTDEGVYLLDGVGELKRLTL